MHLQFPVKEIQITSTASELQIIPVADRMRGRLSVVRRCGSIVDAPTYAVTGAFYLPRLRSVNCANPVIFRKARLVVKRSRLPDYSDLIAAIERDGCDDIDACASISLSLVVIKSRRSIRA